MNHFFVKKENIITEPAFLSDPAASGNGEIRIDGSDVRHIRNVLRMKAGDELLLSDGEGHDYHCVIDRFAEDGEETVLCRILDTETSRSESSVQFYLFQGLPKADKLEHIIQKSVELGVYEIIPVETSRSIVKYDAKKQKSKQERWQKIAESAAKQSHRGIIPEVREIQKFAQALEYARQLDLLLVPYENYKDIGATKETIASIRPGMKVGILIGPEGGFEQSEVERACSIFADDPEKKDCAKQISLGSRILRTETAPLMLLSVLMFALEGE